MHLFCNHETMNVLMHNECYVLHAPEWRERRVCHRRNPASDIPVTTVLKADAIEMMTHKAMLPAMTLCRLHGR
jgi:hypothetical protein